ncbi:MAG: YebC/PmpR family DNA-binding transcriptional regulator [Candidatus Magasanikbacteria bacterium]
MSGHSKWHNIQGKKGKADKARSGMFTKAARMITVAAQQGGADPSMNFSLRLAIEKAKSVNMPKDNIERAIKKGTGELDDGTSLQEILYEGFGPGGVAVLVETVTDNTNRTVSDLKNIFSKQGGSLGGPGSVKWQFNRLGVIRLHKEQGLKIKEQNKDYELVLIEAGADDIIVSEYGLEIHSDVEKFKSILDPVKKMLGDSEPESSGIEWVAKEPVALGSEVSKKVESFVDILDELDDVREVYTNEA